jgi:hypothetical protein
MDRNNRSSGGGVGSHDNGDNNNNNNDDDDGFDSTNDDVMAYNWYHAIATDLSMAHVSTISNHNIYSSNHDPPPPPPPSPQLHSIHSFLSGTLISFFFLDNTIPSSLFDLRLSLLIITTTTIRFFVLLCFLNCGSSCVSISIYWYIHIHSTESDTRY